MLLYLIRNKLTGKLYIGQTKRALAKRWEEHLRSANRYQTHPLYADLREYGVDNFSIELLCLALTQREADILECGLIVLRGTKSPLGYNQTDGGRYGAKGTRMSEATREKLRVHRLGKTASEKTKQKISEAQRGSKNHNFGKTLTPEHR